MSIAGDNPERRDLRRAAWMAWVIAAVGVTGCATGPKSRPEITYKIEPWKYGEVDGRRVSTAHYEIFTTLTDQQLLTALPELMESAFAYFQRLAPPAKARSVDERMPVYLFRTREEWATFTTRFTGPRAPEFLRITNGGYSERGVTVIKYVAHQTTFPIMAHEAFHQYVHHYIGTWMPAWLNEGLATYCEGQRWQGSRVKEFDPWHNPIRRNSLAEALARNELFALPDLLATNAGRVISLSTRAVSTYYAQLWGLILYLREGEGAKYAPSFHRMLAGLSGRDSGEAVLSENADADPCLRAEAIAVPERRSELAPASMRRAAEHRPRVMTGESLFRQYITEDLDAFDRDFRAFLRDRVVESRRIRR